MKSGHMVRRMAGMLAALMLILSFGSSAMAADGLNSAYYKLVEVKRGIVSGDVRVNVRARANADSDKLGRLEPGDSCIVTDEVGDWWEVDYEGRKGYVLKELLTVTDSLEEVEVIVEDPLEASVAGLTPPTILQYRNEYKLSGEVTSNIPLTSVTVEVFNRRTLTVDRSDSVNMKREDEIRSFDLKNIDLSLRKLEPGEKSLVVRAGSINDSMIVAEIPFYVYADEGGYEEIIHMTDDCKLRATHGNEYHLQDQDYETSLALTSSEDTMTVTLPDGRTAEGIAIHWETAPADMTVRFLDANEGELSAVTERNASQMLNFYYDVDSAVRKIVVSTADAGKAISEVMVFEKDMVPDMVQKWEPLPEKLDLLVISTHQDDEMLFFGGTIPYYVMQGKKVGVVYMADCGRDRYAEAMEGLWSCGLTYHPMFVGFVDKRLEDYERTVELWGMDNTVNALVDIMRRYEPEVIVTHDVNGEYGHLQHILTCAAVQEAVTKAGDPAISVESAETYGVWTPKKLYIHLYNDKQIVMDVYDQPFEEMGGMTMTQIATIGYSKHVSQHIYFRMENQGVVYDNRKYGLAFTTVGDDVEKNDFFENID